MAPWVESPTAPPPSLPSPPPPLSFRPPAVPEPADPRRQPLVRPPLLGHVEPPPQTLVLREQLGHRTIGPHDVLGLARERGPSERALALAEHRSDERRHEPGVGEGAFAREAAALGARAQVVAEVKNDRTGLEEPPQRGRLRGPRSVGAAPG